MSKVKLTQKHKINNQIKAFKVMLVGDNVEQGTYSLKDAMKIADEADMDLVLLNENSDTPVCKIMDYAKFIFKQNKNESKSKNKALKTIRFRPNTGTHDLEVKLNQVEKFLKKGHKVKIYVFFKGRELKFKDEGQKLLLELSEKIIQNETGTPENLPKMEGNNKMSLILKPKLK